ncbi:MULTISPECIES: hypothetical protein [Rhizobium]|uniref:Membrane protein n=1 Tax=Rhizobium favelukesii TaxID=348824 RepID=W6RPL0_9HYPH|nr:MULTISPECIES: hypothetical protein [Rhizobium]MCS0462647.1 hypothetical protein [Rhizobium favelukesii]UFS79408.1 hypothetical protein LPB79_07435 [Rhizobium sp. T136]CDM62972.1 putative membrane protein [Rhizobium favelukesii]
MLSFIPDGLKLPAAAACGGLLVGAVLIVVNAMWWLPAAKNEGRVAERTAALQRSMELIKKRGVTNETVGRLSDGDLCHKLGGQWLRDTGTCE